ncbi:MAG: quinoprotein, partial [Pseudomonadota bacterium]
MNAFALKPVSLALGVMAVLLASACAKKEVALTGEREGVRSILSDTGEDALASTNAPEAAPPLNLPATRANT